MCFSCQSAEKSVWTGKLDGVSGQHDRRPVLWTDVLEDQEAAADGCGRDFWHCHQVVYNLIDNAVKFVNEGGCISFSFTKKDGKVFVSIKNTGAGIAQHELPRLFDRFYKTDKSRSLDKTGVGLGLYIVQTIVNQHKGDLIVQSVEGEYTEFTFSVPASDQKAVKEMTKRRERPENSSEE